jgi:hypothetical protein
MQLKLFRSLQQGMVISSFTLSTNKLHLHISTIPFVSFS